jgi:tetratricopeptide (TPR) repeat protein
LDLIMARIHHNDPTWESLHLARLQWAKQTGDWARAEDSAVWLANQARSSHRRLVGLMSLAEKWDAALGASPESPQVIQQTLEAYRRLAEFFGETPHELGRSSNAFVAMTRLGDLYGLAGQWEEAERCYAALSAAAPNDLSTLQKLARCKTQLRKFDEALPIWRRIAQGTEGDEEWLEAKFQIAVCISQRSPQQAEELLEQTILLAGDLPESWRERIEQFRSQLKRDNKP